MGWDKGLVSVWMERGGGQREGRKRWGGGGGEEGREKKHLILKSVAIA